MRYMVWINRNYNIQIYTIFYALFIIFDNKFKVQSQKVFGTVDATEHHHKQMMQLWLSNKRPEHYTA
ncbi:unnamed protein product [Bursaphelenchus okinawaensis]|uniref:Uncharacterized protein n=1 Tax=Bursaphelenchus okinawaensis TaxID=465554 RepID=A0A811KAG2_9BILA|nr:unnamed protein product [Bursaphelenchus okinawaensis]CAG9096208.1 unnamed protein product [Bursaphelenchus okinawaensis]